MLKMRGSFRNRVRQRTNDRLPGQTLKRKKYIFASLVLICVGFDWLLLWCCRDAFYHLLCDAPHLPEKYAQTYTHLKTFSIPPSLIDARHREARVTSMAFSPDNKMLAVGDGTGQKIHFWDIETGDHEFFLKTAQRAVGGVTFSSDGKTVASVSTRSLPWFYHLSMKDLLFNPLSEPIGRSVAQQELFTTYSVEMWDVKTGRKRFFFPAETLLLWSLAFSPDDTKLLLTTYPSFIDVYDTTTGNRLQQLRSVLAHNVMINTYQVNAFAFSPDGKIFASGGRVQEHRSITIADAAIELWDINTGMPLEVLTHPGGRIQLLAFSPDSRILASACGYDFRGCRTKPPNEIYIWDVETHKLISVIHVSDQRSIVSLSFAQDSLILASGHANGTVYLWDIAGRTNLNEKSRK